MVHLKEFQWEDKFYLSVVDMEDALAELGSSFLVYCPLRRPKATHVSTIELSSFAQWISILVEKGADDDSDVYYLWSVHRRKPSLVTEFPMLD